MVITTGGTGITGRDVTPEAFDRVLEKRIEGFGELFRMLSYQKIGTSTMQSRALGGVAGGTYLFALPGSTGAVKDAWDDILVFQLDNRLPPLQPGGADAAVAGASQAGGGVAAPVTRATIASRCVRMSAPRARAAATTSAGADLRRAGVERRRRRIFDLQLNRLRRLRAGEFRHHGQREIDAGGDAAAGEQVAVAHHASGGRGRAERGEQIARAPVRRGAPTAQQAGGAEHQRTGAHRADVARLRRLLDAASRGPPHPPSAR